MANHPYFDLTLPYITPDLLGIGGAIRKRPELFSVIEVPAYDPIGYGDHIYLNVTKQGRTTRDTQIDLARLFGLRREDVGHAGLKDRYAVSTQNFSLLMPVDDPKEVARIVESSLNVAVNWVKRHPKKLRTGHLHGNMFTITVTDLDSQPDTVLSRALKIQKAVTKRGIPNYFGIQRIGRDGRNILNGYDLITGGYKEHNRWLRRFLISSYLSYLCNRYLAERVRRDLFIKLLHGDLAKKHNTGGVFTVEDTAAEQPRFDAGEISFTAPIFGYKMRESKYEAKELEDVIFTGSGITVDQLHQIGAEGTRRLGRILPDITVQKHPEGITLSFTLPAGAYATVVLREFMKDDVDIEASEPDLKENDEAE